MAATYYFNPYSGEGDLSQYKKYLQNQSYINQIEGTLLKAQTIQSKAIPIQLHEVQKAIDSSSQELKEVIYDLSYLVYENLAPELDRVSDHLFDIRYEIQGLNNLVGHCFSLVTEEQKITNLYLKDIAGLLKIPDSQKQRVYHIEEGVKYLKNALGESSPRSEFYTDALDEFKKAEQIEEKDYFSLYYIGYIHLKSIRHLDFVSAEMYFRNSARYYLAEAFVRESGLPEYMAHLDKKSFMSQAAEAYLYAAEACQFQKRCSEAAILASKAWETFPRLVRAGFMQSKYLSASGKPSEAANVLEKVINLNRNFAKDVIIDKDLISKKEIQNLLKKLRNQAYTEAITLLIELTKNTIQNSAAKEELDHIEQLIDKKSYLHCKKALDLFNAVKERKFLEKKLEGVDILKDKIQELLEPDRDGRNRGHTLEYYYNSYTNRVPKYLEKVKQVLGILSEKTQWTFVPDYIQYKIKKSYDKSFLCSSESIKSIQLTTKIFNSNLIDFIEQERLFHENSPDILEQSINEIEELIIEDKIIRKNEYRQRAIDKKKRDKIYRIYRLKKVLKTVFSYAVLAIAFYFSFKIMQGKGSFIKKIGLFGLMAFVISNLFNYLRFYFKSDIWDFLGRTLKNLGWGGILGVIFAIFRVILNWINSI